MTSSSTARGSQPHVPSVVAATMARERRRLGHAGSQHALGHLVALDLKGSVIFGAQKARLAGHCPSSSGARRYSAARRRPRGHSHAGASRSARPRRSSRPRPRPSPPHSAAVAATESRRRRRDQLVYLHPFGLRHGASPLLTDRMQGLSHGRDALWLRHREITRSGSKGLQWSQCTGAAAEVA